MGVEGQWLPAIFDILLLDVLLGVDNAMVIALACRALPPHEQRQAMTAGTLLAVALRVVLVGFASLLSALPLFRLASGIALAAIAIQLLSDEGLRGTPTSVSDRNASAADLRGAIATIVVADVLMSADNAVGLIAMAHDHIGLLAFGVLVNVPLLLYGSRHAASWLRDFPWLVPLGGAILGWFAGDIAITDALYAHAVSQQSPGLHVVVPALAAVFVLVESRIVIRRRSGAAVLRPGRHLVAMPTVASPEATSISPSTGSGRTVAGPRVSSWMPGTPIGLRLPGIRVGQGIRWPQVPRGWAISAGAALVLAATLAIAWLLLRGDGTEALARYACTDDGVTVYYRHGADTIAMSRGTVRVVGALRPDRQIDWHDYLAVSRTLGIAPPTSVRESDEQGIAIDGGSLEHATCTLR
ncbi:MAG: YjbE family putative metal transport protein [Proteobacteria bacterium]|nr:YjbE family putative metal transport protein [Pseudomonadota bacterium]